MPDNPYFLDLAAAFVRGTIRQTGEQRLDSDLLTKPLELLTDDEKQAIITAGSDLKLHRFKRSHAEMPRVRRTIGFLHGILPQSILDIGSGRGAFFWTCLDAFPSVPVTAIDIDKQRVNLYETVRLGGMEQLKGIHCDLQAPPPEFLEQRFDVVTMLEVLEHLSDPETALRHGVRLAQRHVVISVPSKEDDNPAHLRLFSEQSLGEMFERIDSIKRFRYDYVLGHLFAFLTIRS